MHTGIDEDVTGQRCSALQHNCSLLDLCHLIDNALHSALQHSADLKADSFCSTFQHPNAMTSCLIHASMLAAQLVH